MLTDDTGSRDSFFSGESKPSQSTWCKAMFNGFRLANLKTFFVKKSKKSLNSCSASATRKCLQAGLCPGLERVDSDLSLSGAQFAMCYTGQAQPPGGASKNCRTQNCKLGRQSCWSFKAEWTRLQGFCDMQTPLGMRSVETLGKL